MGLKLALFVLLSLCYSLVSSKVLCELDKSDLSRAQFYGQLNTSMKYPVLEYQNITIYDCARSCRQEVTCLSYSYSSYSEECQLFEFDSETTPEYLTERGGYTYYDMVNRWTNHRVSIQNNTSITWNVSFAFKVRGSPSNRHRSRGGGLHSAGEDIRSLLHV